MPTTDHFNKEEESRNRAEETRKAEKASLSIFIVIAVVLLCIFSFYLLR